ncbi:hypothetical protein ACLMJK_008788 [Lecanora helva]
MGSTSASRAHVILEAVRYTTDGEIPSLRQLAAERPDTLKLETTLRILLTYLPVGLKPELYTEFLRDLPTISSYPLRQIPSSSRKPVQHDFSDDEARKRVRRLHLTPLVNSSDRYNQDADPLTLFLLHQAHRIDAETGSLELASQLLEPFVDHSETLRTWMISHLLPLLRLDYEYYPHSGPAHSLSEFERLDGASAVQNLLSKAVQQSDPSDTQKIGRDLRGLVGPWMYGERSRKRRKLGLKVRRQSSVTSDSVAHVQESLSNASDGSGWSHVNEWLVDFSLRDFQRAVDAATQWDGPSDVDYGDWAIENLAERKDDTPTATRRYEQAALASIYATNTSSLETIIGSHRTLLQVAKLVGFDQPSDLQRTDSVISSAISNDFLTKLSPAHLLRNALLSAENPLTLPTQQSINLLNLILASAYRLVHMGNIKATRNVAELMLFGNEIDQITELRTTLHRQKAKRKDEGVWASIRRQILWLRDPDQESPISEHSRGVFGRMTISALEVELLQAILDGGCYNLAVDIYLRPKNPPLPARTVEDSILETVWAAYDAASNGNRTRGDIRKASEMIHAFREYFPDSTSFSRVSALLSATHAISFYSLTLQHGVPFRPVNIRAHKDPLSLIGRILGQNTQSYTHLDNLLEIGQNLVAAGLTQQSHELSKDNLTTPNTATEQDLVIARRRIIRMAIEAALEEDDFDTAYSYVVNRLRESDPAKAAFSNDESKKAAPHDDISWRAAYQAGCYSSTKSNRLTLRRLEQRLELLSEALVLAPPTALSEVLTAWQNCEQELITQIAREAAEDEKWNEKGDRSVPGGFTADSEPVVQKSRDPARGALVEEAPIGLFDVARGAAAALSKSTFPLRNGTRADLESPAKAARGRPLSSGSAGSSDEGNISGAGEPGRVRKRDMVSNMVTGGLVSGIGWVIGESLLLST